MRAALALLPLVAACGSTPWPAPCTIRTGPDGTRELVCPDGSRAPIDPGECTIDASPPTPVLVCGDTRAPLPSGCTFEARENGVRVLHCGGADVLLPSAPEGALEGVVTRIGEEDASGVRVALEGTPYATTTDAAGAYHLVVPVGTYTATFTADAFGVERIPALLVDSGGRRLDVLLRRSTRIGGDVTTVYPSSNERAAALVLDGRVAVVRAGRPEPVVLGEASEIAPPSVLLSPDGSALLWGTRVTLLDTGAEVPLGADCRHAAFSPSGSRLACESGGQLLVFGLDGGDPMDAGGVGEWGFLWRGEALLAAGSEGIRLLPEDGGPIVPLSNEPCSSLVEVEGGLALCDSLLVDPARRKVVALGAYPYPESIRVDARRRFAACAGNASGHLVSEIADLEQGTTALAASGRYAAPAAFSPDGRYVAFSAWPAPFVLWNLETGREQLTDADAAFVAFTPDSAPILVAADRSLQVRDPLTGESTVVDARAVDAAGALDARFAQIDVEGEWYLLDLVDLSRTPVPDHASDVTADGSAALFTPYYGAPWLVELPSLRQARLPASAARPVFSPTGKEVLYDRGLPGGVQLEILDRERGRIRAADRGRLRQLAVITDRVLYTREPGRDEDPSIASGVFWTPLR